MSRYFGIAGVLAATTGSALWAAGAALFALAVSNPALLQGEGMREVALLFFGVAPIACPLLGLLAIALGLTGYVEARMSGGYSLVSLAAVVLGGLSILMGLAGIVALGAIAVT